MTNTPNETDELKPDPSTETPDTARGTMLGKLNDVWVRSANPAHISYRWLIMSVLLGFVFVGCALWAVVETVQLENRVTRQQLADSIATQIITCETTNDVRENAKIIAEEALSSDQSSLDRDLSALHNDEANWLSLDELFDNGIPEPARTTIFDGLAQRQAVIEIQQEMLDKRAARIEATYLPSPCEEIAEATSTSADTTN